MPRGMAKWMLWRSSSTANSARSNPRLDLYSLWKEQLTIYIAMFLLGNTQMSERFMPKKPVMRPLAGDFQYRENVNAVTEHDFNKWWQAEIVPLFENAVEVWLDSETATKWSEYHKSDYKKGMLINIQPIKEQTAEDLLREFLAARGHHGSYLDDLYLKVRNFLEKKK